MKEYEIYYTYLHDLNCHVRSKQNILIDESKLTPPFPKTIEEWIAAYSDINLLLRNIQIIKSCLLKQYLSMEGLLQDVPNIVSRLTPISLNIIMLIETYQEFIASQKNHSKEKKWHSAKLDLGDNQGIFYQLTANLYLFSEKFQLAQRYYIKAYDIFYSDRCTTTGKDDLFRANLRQTTADKNEIQRTSLKNAFDCDFRSGMAIIYLKTNQFEQALKQAKLAQVVNSKYISPLYSLMLHTLCLEYTRQKQYHLAINCILKLFGEILVRDKSIPNYQVFANKINYPSLNQLLRGLHKKQLESILLAMEEVQKKHSNWAVTKLTVTDTNTAFLHDIKCNTVVAYSDQAFFIMVPDESLVQHQRRSHLHSLKNFIHTHSQGVKCEISSTDSHDFLQTFIDDIDPTILTPLIEFSGKQLAKLATATSTTKQQTTANTATTFLIPPVLLTLRARDNTSKESIDIFSKKTKIKTRPTEMIPGSEPPIPQPPSLLISFKDNVLPELALNDLRWPFFKMHSDFFCTELIGYFNESALIDGRLDQTDIDAFKRVAESGKIVGAKGQGIKVSKSEGFPFKLKPASSPWRLFGKRVNPDNVILNDDDITVDVYVFDTLKRSH